MHPAIHSAADRMRRRLAEGPVDPAEVRRALGAVPVDQRDPWVDRVFDVDPLAEDGPDLPPGCVPYLPCDVDTLLRVVDAAGVTADDVFVDVGAGVGRAAALVHLVTGAEVVAVEVQAGLAAEARALAARVAPGGLSVLHGDAPRLVGGLDRGTVFFLYCPFSGDRLAALLDALPRRSARVCTVDLPLPERPWLEPVMGDARLTLCRIRP